MNLYNKFTKNFTETEQKTAHVIHRMTGLSFILSVSIYFIIFSVHISDSQVLQLPE